jgi:anti-sigma B factor antagonist
MDINHRKSGSMNIFTLSGSLDIYTAVELKQYFESIVKEKDNEAVIDLEKVSYVDSSGIGMLIKIMNYVKALNGKFYLTNMKPPLEKVFKVAGLSSYFSFIGDRDFAERYP